MKRNAIVRIVLYSIAILMLTGILLAGLGFGTLRFDAEPDGKDYTTGSGSADAEAVTKLNIAWAAGSIRIFTANTDTITFSDTGSVSNPLVYALEGDTLTIRYDKPGFAIGFFSDIPKDLTITVPRFWMCSSLSIESAAADLYVYDLFVENFELKNASGECEFDSCNITYLDVETASGSIFYEGSLNMLECDAASADFTGILKNSPDWIKMNCASGDLDLTLPSDCGFVARMDTLSGKFISDLNTTYISGAYQHGDRSCKIDFDGASGNVIIRKSQYSGW